MDSERGFNTNDRFNHACRGERCSACGRFGCEDYVHGTQATAYCPTCHGLFYGPRCQQYHRTSQQCQTFKTCFKCQARYTVAPDKRHQCGYAKSPVCHQWVFIQDHKCYIQPVVEEEEEEGRGSMEAPPPPPPPLFVYADFKAMHMRNRKPLDTASPVISNDRLRNPKQWSR